MGRAPENRVIIRCDRCGRPYLGVLDDRGGVHTIAGDRCPNCDGAEFSVVGPD